MVLDAAPDPQVVAEASDGIEAVERALRDDIDLAVVDVAMPRGGGLHAGRTIAWQRPGLRVLMPVDAPRGRLLLRGLLRGAQGGRSRLRATASSSPAGRLATGWSNR
jgi:DNA-binding NarL/FixJ family response regulator